MKKIIISLAIIGMVGAVAIGGTIAYFSDVARVEGNVFAMGTVKIGEKQNMPFEFGNLAPGETSKTPVLRVQYDGTLPADLYFGVNHQSGDDLKDILEYRIERMKWEDGQWVRHSWIDTSAWKDVAGGEGPFAKWIKIQTDLEAGDWGNFRLQIRVKEGDEVDFDDIDFAEDWNWYQGKSATNEVILYAVQTGGDAPVTPPWQY